jgi:hypothetical protein
MSNMIIVKPLAISTATAPGSSGALNILTPDPKEVVVGGGAGTYFMNIDMGSSVTIDTVFLGGLSSGTYLSALRSATGMGTGTVSLYSPGAPTVAAPYGFKKLAAPVASRYFQVDFGNPSAAPMAGVLVLGLAFQPTFNREWGSGRPIIDTGAKEPLLGGGFGIGEGARKGGFRWTFGDLTDAEIETLYDLAKDRGETRSILVCEDPDDTTNLGKRLHYGLFDRLEVFERANPSQTRWSMSMTEWV